MIGNKKLSIILIVLNILACIFVAFPIIYAILGSFMPPPQLSQGMGANLIPWSFHWKNYTDAFAAVPLFGFIVNSFFISIAQMILQLIVGSLAAYAFAMFDFRGKKFAFMVVISTMMIPFQSIVLANFQTITALGLIDTPWAIIVPSIASAFTIFNLRQSFASQPKELKEAADIDGCRDFRFLWQITIPINRPILSSCAIIAFILSWNDYLWPLLVTNSIERRTLQIGVSMMRNAMISNYGPILAAGVIALVPSLTEFIICQRQLISGLAAGAVKG